MPGKVYAPWLEQKVKNEVMVLKCLAQHTKIPVPRVYHWGLTEESPQRLGPFIIEEFMEEEELGSLIRKPRDDEDEPSILDPGIDDAKLDYVYEQVASFMVQLSRLEFPSIGAIAVDSDNNYDCKVTEPPLTYDMNEIVGFAHFPAEEFAATTPFGRASDYFADRARCLQVNLETHRNIAYEDDDTVWKRYIARQCLEQLVPIYGGGEDDGGPFRLFCDDMRPFNMLADPATLRITAVLDLEFTNAMPAQYACDVPWWLVLGQPGVMICDGKQEFLDMFEPRKDQFIRAVERVEATSPLRDEARPRLSVQMRESWDSGRFWFNLAMRNSFDVDAIYWAFLHEEGRGEQMLDSATLARRDEFLKRKRDQFAAYVEEKNGDERFREE